MKRKAVRRSVSLFMVEIEANSWQSFLLLNCPPSASGEKAGNLFNHSVPSLNKMLTNSSIALKTCLIP
jgi:hypothetical protein